MRAHGGWFQNRPFGGLRTPKSEIYDPQNLVKNFFFRTCTILFPKVHPKRSLLVTHPHRPPSDQNCPIAPGSNFFPMWTCHVAMSKRRRSDLTAHPATRKRFDAAADLGCELHLRICPRGHRRIGGLRGDEGSPSRVLSSPCVATGRVMG